VIEDKMLGLTRVTLLFGGLGICRLSGLWPRNGRGKHRGESRGPRLPGVQIAGEAMIFASAEINGRDRLAFRRERSAQQLHLPVVVDVLIGPAHKNVRTDLDGLVELAPFE
jgi:hypothetical protein